MKRIYACLIVSLFLSIIGADSAYAKMPEIFPLKRVVRGMKASALSTFRGTKVEKFEVTLNAVMGAGVESYITFEAAGGPLPSGFEESGILAGMSGSPVFIGCDMMDAAECAAFGILVGAISATPSQNNTLKGSNAFITPAEFMFGALTGGYEAVRSATASPESAKEVMDAFTRSARITENPVHENPEAEKAELRPGSMIEIIVARGSVPVTAAGTVTWVDGDRLWAFGHGFIGAGHAGYPFHQVAVIDSIQSRDGSYKIAGYGVGNEGVITMDGQREIFGIIGQEARYIPIRAGVRVGGKTFSFFTEVAAGNVFTENILWGTLFSWMQKTFGVLGNSALTYTSRIVLRDQPEIFLHNITLPEESGVLEPSSIVLPLVSAIKEIRASGYAFAYDKIDISAEIGNVPVLWQNKDIFLSKKKAVPGETVLLNVVLEKFPDGKPFRTIQVPITVPNDILSRKSAATEKSVPGFTPKPGAVSAQHIFGSGSAVMQITVESGSAHTDQNETNTPQSLQEAIAALNRRTSFKPNAVYVQQVLASPVEPQPAATAAKDLKPEMPNVQLPAELVWNTVGNLAGIPRNTEDKNQVISMELPEIEGKIIDFSITLPLAVEASPQPATTKAVTAVKKKKRFGIF